MDRIQFNPILGWCPKSDHAKMFGFIGIYIVFIYRWIMGGVSINIYMGEYLSLGGILQVRDRNTLDVLGDLGASHLQIRFQSSNSGSRRLGVWRWAHNPPKVDRIWGIWGSNYNIPKAIFYLLKSDYRVKGLVA